MKSVKILCPTDFSEPAQRALRFATELALSLSASIELVHVLQVPVYMGWEDGPAAPVETARYLEQSREQVDRQLSALAGPAQEAGVAVSTRRVDGVPHQAISELSATADMIVMGTHGRTGLSHVFLGSVAERVLRLSKCPVITVPSGEHARA